jgi:hypothetical protein
MPYMHLLSDSGMNYTLNRPLLDGTSPATLKEIGAVASRIRGCDSWHTVSRRAEAEKGWADAASYYHWAEFHLPAGDALVADNALHRQRPIAREEIVRWLARFYPDMGFAHPGGSLDNAGKRTCPSIPTTPSNSRKRSSDAEA